MKPPATKLGVKRCALYTRKSSEEGLEQDFNSLHAQREACASYVSSQKAEGWKALPAVYDDGGFSGGTIERPALRRLLDDVQSGNIDIIVVYKIDRLTRSLADFARMVELFERHQVSFVSVTQAFNTTSSMGRLTLNVLLSFAQFEREVTGERIRDKIAASKAKGMWMGGTLPLGYDLSPSGARTLVANVGVPLEVPHHRTVASLMKQGLIAEKRGRNKHSLVATPAGVALLRQCEARAAEAAQTAPPAPARAARRRAWTDRAEPTRTVESAGKDKDSNPKLTFKHARLQERFLNRSAICKHRAPVRPHDAFVS